MDWFIDLFIFFVVFICWLLAPESQARKPEAPKQQALKPRAPKSRAAKSHAIQSRGAEEPSQIVHTQRVAANKAHVSLLIEEDRQWRKDTHDALVKSSGGLKSFYNMIREGFNESFEPLNAASRVDIPDRRALTITETNPNSTYRNISIRYRPLRSSMQQDGIKGVGLKILSHFQTAGHWAIVIGPYTYDIYQENKRVMFNAGEWHMGRPDEKYLVNDRDVGFTSKTDLEIYDVARDVYETMKREEYDMKFNNCHRFVNLVTSRVSNHNIATVRLRFLYIWRLMPASWIFQTTEYVKQYGKIGKMLRKIVFEIEKHGLDRNARWQAVKKQGLVATKLIGFLLMAGPMNVFLIMAKELLGWDPDIPEYRTRYLSFFKMIPSIDDTMAENFFEFAFKGHKGVKTVIDRMIQETQDCKGMESLMDSLVQRSQVQVKKLAPQTQNI